MYLQNYCENEALEAFKKNFLLRINSLSYVDLLIFLDQEKSHPILDKLFSDLIFDTIKAFTEKQATLAK